MCSVLSLQIFCEADTIVIPILSETKAKEIKYLTQVTELISDSRSTGIQMSLCFKSSINLINKSSL